MSAIFHKPLFVGPITRRNGMGLMRSSLFMNFIMD